MAPTTAPMMPTQKLDAIAIEIESWTAATMPGMSGWTNACCAGGVAARILAPRSPVPAMSKAAAARELADELRRDSSRGEPGRQLLRQPAGEDRARDGQADRAADLLEERQAAGGHADELRAGRRSGR